MKRLKHNMDRDKVIPKVNKIPGPRARKWTSFHMKHAAPSTLFYGFVWDKTKEAIGPWCTDVDGNIILDFASHVASAPLGYNHPVLIELIKKIVPADPDRYAGTDFIAAYGESPERSEIPTPGHLHHLVNSITKHLGMDKAFFSNSGAEAVENAIKLCYGFRRNNGYGICFDGAFHGRTLGALSLNRSKTVQRKFYPQIPKIISLKYHHALSPPEEECGLAELLDKKKGIVDPSEVAYVIIEPIQGEGGFRIPQKKFMQNIYGEARANGIPVISDEIQAGLGRTGKWWACENFNVKPDIITSAKALRIGATIGKKELFPSEKGRISSTWGEGNALASAVGYTTIKIMQKEKLLHNAARLGGYFLKSLRKIRSRHIVDVRGLGLMDAVEFSDKKIRDAVQNECLKNGMVVLGTGHKALRFLPPLNITRREIDVAVDILEKSIRKVR